MPRTARGFTLIELLVVIAIIALLIGILLPALRTARESGKAAVCLSNQKNLAIAFVGYAGANDDDVVSSWIDAKSWCDWPMHPDGSYYSDADLRRATDTEGHKRGIRNGVLYPFADAVEVFHCPSDGRLHPNARRRANIAYRTYSMPNCMNGDRGWEDWVGSGDVTRKTHAIPLPSTKYAFLEESDPRGVNMHSWVMRLYGYRWVDPLTIWHSERSTIGFADGHAEIHTWLDRRTIEMSRDQQFDQTHPGSLDWEMMAGGWVNTKKD